ncbi:MAG: ABC transporter permease [Planctomycetota bacterium]|jgi:ABC-type transport system involved in multi-copper enzyme maturation permease subunit
MPVDQAAYRPYEGLLRPGRGALMAITGTTVRRVFRRTWIRLIFLVVVIINLVQTSLMSFMTHREVMGGRSLGEMVEEQGMGELDPFAMALRGFYSQIAILAPLIAALTAATLIAEDRRAKALPLYFSRPITHIHYVLGKMGAACFFLAAVLILPPIAMFLVEIANAPDSVDYVERLGMLARGLTPLAVLTVSMAAISLGVSSLVERSNAASLALFGVIILSVVGSHTMVRLVTHDENWYALNPFAATQRIADELLPPLPRLQLPVSPIPQTAKSIALPVAWWSLISWGAAGIVLLWWRIRKVEVVE